MRRKKTKTRHMTDETFTELMTSAKQALAYERGAVSGHRIFASHARIFPLYFRGLADNGTARGLTPLAAS